MPKVCRGIALEKAAVCAEQRNVTIQQELNNLRRRPSLAVPLSRAKDIIRMRESYQFAPVFEEQSYGRVADAKPLKIERCLDMDQVKKGSFFYMSKNYEEEVKDWSRFIEESQNSTF
ncbi:hypothetical protein F5Y11DRAFT_348716 [Daldinia sp. FL1419]|nr:hypothetical protein F5Y11DRAFT_348716 [Daldinia sp. FL1419]